MTYKADKTVIPSILTGYVRQRSVQNLERAMNLYLNYDIIFNILHIY